MSSYDRRHVYIDGGWRASAGDVIEVDSAITGEIIGTIPDGTADDVAAAVVAARAAFPGWSQTPMDVRLDFLAQLSKKLDERADELTQLITTEVGTPLRVSTAVQVGQPRRVLDSYRELMADFPLEEQIGDSLVLREPIGVVAAITAWNFPLAAGDRKSGRRAGDRLHRGAQAVRSGAAERLPRRRHDRRDRSSARGIQPSVRHRSSGRRSVGRPPRRRHDHLHRFDSGWPTDRRGCGPHGQTGGPRAGRQVGERDSR